MNNLTIINSDIIYQQPNIGNSTYLTYVIRGNLHRINRAGNACQARRGYARVYSTNYGLRVPKCNAGARLSGSSCCVNVLG